MAEVGTSVGWTGEGVASRLLYEGMAEHSFAGVSPSYQAIARAVAADESMLRRLDALPPAKRQPNLLLGAVRYLDGPTDGAAAFLIWTHERWDEVVAVMMTHRTQTNEPRRCATLLPVLAAVPGPVALIEVGASAGLCLLPDRYAYRYRTADDEVAVGRSSLVLDCEVSGPAPLPAEVPDVVWRRGLDLNPLDVASDDDVRWLRALIWPEQTSRFTNFDAALEIARADPPLVQRGNLLTDLAGLVQEAPVDSTVVVMHSAVLAYLGPLEREPFAASLRSFDREVVWVSNEAPGIVVDLDRGDRPDLFVLARDGAPLAWTGAHGQTLEWIA